MSKHADGRQQHPSFRNLLACPLGCLLARFQEHTNKQALPVASLDRYYRPFLHLQPPSLSTMTWSWWEGSGDGWRAAPQQTITEQANTLAVMQQQLYHIIAELQDLKSSVGQLKEQVESVKLSTITSMRSGTSARSSVGGTSARSSADTAVAPTSAVTSEECANFHGPGNQKLYAMGAEGGGVLKENYFESWWSHVHSLNFHCHPDPVLSEYFKAAVMEHWEKFRISYSMAKTTRHMAFQ